MLNNKLKGFTMPELMVTLAITGMMAAFAYMGYNHINKLFKLFNDQSRFITELNELDKRLANLSAMPGKVVKVDETKFLITNDSSEYVLQFNAESIWLSKGDVTDTFRFKPVNIKCEPEPGDEAGDERLIRRINFDCYFQKQKFSIMLNKKYDGYFKLARIPKNN